MDSDSGADVSIDIGDIREIKIVKKSKAWIGAGIGFLIGVVPGAIIGYNAINGKDPGHHKRAAFMGGLIIGLLGSIPGALIGSAFGIDKKIQIEGKSDSEIKEILEKLRKKARVKNFQ